MEGVNLKISAAVAKIADLYRLIRAFMRTHPYQVGTRKNTDGRIEYYLSKVKPQPIRINIITGDVLQYLRTALDHMAFSMYIKGGMESDERKVSFPIFENKERYEDWKKKQTIPEFRTEIINVLDEIMPYKEGNLLLWQLNKLNNIDKHRLVLTAGGCPAGFDFLSYILDDLKSAHGEDFRFSNDDAIFVSQKPYQAFMNEGDVVFVDQPHDTPRNIRFRWKVIVDEPDIVEGEDVIELLRAMLIEVVAVRDKLSKFFYDDSAEQHKFTSLVDDFIITGYSVDIFATCDYGAIYDGKLTVVGVFDHLHADKFPFVFDKGYLAVRVKLFDVLPGEHEIKIDFLSEAGTISADQLIFKINVQKQDNLLFQQALPIGRLEFSGPGQYKVQLRHNSDLLYEIYLNVVKKVNAP